MGYNNLQNLLLSNSTFANYSAWASQFSTQMAAIGWTQTTDTGQVVWTASVTAITAASLSGSNTTYTYTLTSGPALRVGMSVVITGMANSGNNGTFTITSLGSGTFTVVNASGVTASSQSGTGTVTALAALPTNNTRDYEIWQPADSLQTGSSKFYLRVYYGTNSGAATIGFCVSTTTDGAGNPTGTSTNSASVVGLMNTGGNATITGDCYFCGDVNRLAVLWNRSNLNTSSGWGGAFVVERTKNSDGTDNTDGVFILIQGSTRYNGTISFSAASIDVFPGTALPMTTTPLQNISGGSSFLFNNSVAVHAIFPFYGKVGYPVTGAVYVNGTDVSEGTFIVTTLYGAQRTYMCTSGGNASFNSWRIGVRFD